MKVAVVVPARNAAALLVDCLTAVLRQTEPPDEVLLSIGPSSDGTHEVADRLAGGIVRILDNPAGDRGSAINLALDATDADLVAMVDTQARLEPDYLERATGVLADETIAVAGGPMRPQGRTAIGRAMALALGSPFGVGDSQFHFAGEARDVESVYLGVYRSEAFKWVGRYNPALLRTEDDDLNARVREAGMRIRLDPSIRSTYLCRDTLRGVWSQYFGYGFWKVALGTVRPGALRLRHLVPAVFMLAVVASAVLALSGWVTGLFLLAGSYLVAAIGFAGATRRADPAALALFPVVALTMHLAYGTGTLVALPQWASLRRRALPTAPEARVRRE